MEAELRSALSEHERVSQVLPRLKQWDPPWGFKREAFCATHLKVRVSEATLPAVLLTISTTHTPATDLGYLLAKNPTRAQTFSLTFGKAHVFYPEASDTRCTAALLLDLDPLDLVQKARKQTKRNDSPLTRYVNDRPYVSSSFMSVALSRVFGSALGGKSRERPELTNTAIPLEACVSALPARGGERFLRSLFEPLGYEVSIDFPEGGVGPYCALTLRGKVRLSELLSHLYVLIPVLDNQKHYWVGADEIDKLLDKGGQWLKEHPARDEITSRYLKRQRRLTRMALERMTEGEEVPDEMVAGAEEAALEKPLSLNQVRMKRVLEEVREAGGKSVVDLGCGEGRLLKMLLREKSLTKILGMDVAMNTLEKASERLRLDELPDRQRERVSLIQGSLSYRDARLSGFDVACAIEVIEHMDASRLDAFERVVFESAAPKTVIVTTPNVEHNVRFENLPAGKMRHRDHRFEWTRAEFQDWANGVASRHGYAVSYAGIGDDDAEVGPPTQMAVFTRDGAHIQTEVTK